MNNLKPNSGSFSQSLAISLVCVYQRLKPALDQVVIAVFGSVSECKHKPTCSEYMIAQIRRHGTIAGIVQGVKRIWSCR